VRSPYISGAIDSRRMNKRDISQAHNNLKNPYYNFFWRSEWKILFRRPWCRWDCDVKFPLW